MQQQKTVKADVCPQHDIFFGTGSDARLWRGLLRRSGNMRIAGGLLRLLTRKMPGMCGVLRI